MRYCFFIVVLLTLYSCNLNPDAPRDRETNEYYALYVEIYQNYGKVPDEETLSRLEEYIVKFPIEPRAYVFKGIILANEKKFDQAETSFNEALKLDSLNFNALMSLAHLDRLKGNYTGAKTYIAISEPLDSIGSYILSHKAILSACQENWEESEKLTKEAIQLDSTNRFALRNAVLLKFDSSEEYLNALKRHSRFDVPAIKAVQSKEQIIQYYRENF